jgi:NADPH:quinone reductase-like Zn-dependent oxidoreductase
VLQGLLPPDGGVHVVLDCVGRNYAEAHLDALSMDGRWILYR